MERNNYTLFTRIAGLTIKWVTDCEFEHEKLLKLLAHHLVDKGDVDTVDHTVTFLPILHDLPVPKDARLHWRGMHIACVPNEDPMTWLKVDALGLDYLLLNREIAVIHDPQPSVTKVCLRCKEGDDGRLVRPDFRDSIIVTLQTLMSLHNRYAIHSGAVELDGVAHLFLGKSGSGKSTLSTDLSRLGANFMGDDIVFLYQDNGVPMVGSFLMEAKLIPEGVTVKQIVDSAQKYMKAKKKGRRADAPEFNKEMLDAITVNGNAVVLEAPLRSISTVCRGSEALSTMEPQSQIDCLLQLIDGTNDAPMQCDPKEWQRVCQMTAEKVPYFLFHFGDRKSLTLSVLPDA